MWESYPEVTKSWFDVVGEFGTFEFGITGVFIEFGIAGASNAGGLSNDAAD